LAPKHGKFFQAGYVVRDADAAMAAAKAKFGVGKWHVRRLPPGGPLQVLATAWVGGVMWEYLQFDPELMPDIYRDFVPESPEDVRFNHVAYMLESEADLRAVMSHNESIGIGVALHMDMGEILECYYADTLPQLGHYTEYVWLKPKGRDFFAETPHND
jgi:hypothetical protein